tara:strand:+ start:129 stop:563 length:435 start_codon:yes stop_codon:yes gene_type:complete
MKLTKLIASMAVVAMTGQGVTAVNLRDSGVECSLNSLGNVVCETSPLISLEGTAADSGNGGGVEDVIESYNGGAPLDFYQKVLFSILLFQLTFCLGMCWWASLKEEQAKNNLVNQQAEYYQFIYQFHSQMEAEMCALQNVAQST